MVTILTVVALTTFPELGRALMVPAAYATVNLVQSNVVSPLLLAKTAHAQSGRALRGPAVLVLDLGRRGRVPRGPDAGGSQDHVRPRGTALSYRGLVGRTGERGTGNGTGTSSRGA